MAIVLRATALFAILFVLLRLLGKRELGQMMPFEVVLLVVFGDLIQQGVTHNDLSVTGATLAIVTFGFWALLLSWAVYLWPKLEGVLEGRPRIIVEHGKLIERTLRQDRLTVAEVESEMRLAGIPRLEKVEWAILEPNGKISFIERPADTKPSRQQDESEAL